MTVIMEMVEKAKNGSIMNIKENVRFSDTKCCDM
jgi:hypothetical protein